MDPLKWSVHNAVPKDEKTMRTTLFFDIKREIYLDPLKWSVHNAPKDEETTRTADVKSLGIPYYKISSKKRSTRSGNDEYISESNKKGEKHSI